jgi:hypothetical protein
LGNKPEAQPAALGFRVKSGWAMAVLLAGPSTAPSLLRCQSVLLSDPKVPGSKQPYHAALELPEKDAAIIVQKLRKVVSTAAERSVADLFKQAGEAGYVVRGAALVVGSLVDPASLHNEHIRAHGLEGQLFRTALEDAFRLQSVPCTVLLEKTAYATAATALHKSAAQAKRIATNLGDSHDGAWRAEEKLATLAAWMSLVAHAKTR